MDMYTIGNRLPLRIQDMIDYKENSYQKLGFRAARYIQLYCHDFFSVNPDKPSELKLNEHPFSDYEFIRETVMLYINFLSKTGRIDEPALIEHHMETGTSVRRIVHMLNSSIQSVTNELIRNQQLAIVLEALSTETKEFR